MADSTAPSATSAPATNGTFPADDAAGQTVAAIAEADKISAGRSDPVLPVLVLSGATDEIALYDRQIRLWGVQAQEK